MTLVSYVLSLLHKIEGGLSYSVDLKERKLKIDRRDIEIDLTNVEHLSLEECLGVIENLFYTYQHSVPSARDNYKRYFNAIKLEDLTEDDMLYGARRREAQFVLEVFVLCAIIHGDLRWTDDMGLWFWQSERMKPLIILKEWVVGE